jgi:translocation and assembly module TamB
VRGAAVGAPKLDVTATVDRDKPRLEVTLKGTAPDAQLHLVAEVDAKRAVRWDADGHVARLGPLAALLPVGPGWDQLSAKLTSHGSLTGVVRAVADGVPMLAADPLATVRGQAQLELAVRDLHYHGAAETSADLDALTLRAAVDLGAARSATVDLDAPAAAAIASGVNLAVEGLHGHLDAHLDAAGAGRAVLEVRARTLRQSAFPSYPVRNGVLAVDVSGAPKAAVTLHARLDNPAAGTTFTLNGQLDQRAVAAADAVPGRRSLTLDGELDQSLAELDGAPDVLRASGRLTVPFTIESGDLELFRVGALVKLDDVTIDLPLDRVHTGGVRGQVPIVEEVVRGPAGIAPVGRGERGLYPQLRFSDQQPFLKGEDYLTVRELRVGDHAYGPLAGNVRLDRDVLALDQLELAALGGTITGQCLVEVAGRDTRLTFRGKVTGLHPSSGADVLDANAALALTPYRLGLEGRVEIVRIGRQHLYDLLDLYDPYGADVAANRVRLALKVGYPEQVRLHFQHGFASLAVELGGLAGVVRIDEIKGVPIGPALSRWLAPVLEARP